MFIRDINKINGSFYDKKCNMTELVNQACFGYLYVRILNYKNIESTGDPYIIQKNIRNFKKEGWENFRVR